MKRKSYGRDAGLTLRIILTSGMLGLLYVIFALVLFQALNVGLVPMLVIVVGIAGFQYWSSESSLAVSGAKIAREDAPDLRAVVERLCALTDLPKPRIAVIDTMPNACHGPSPKRAAVAVTTGLWRRLPPQEIEAVLALSLAIREP
jgi:heat shock protein HtpX